MLFLLAVLTGALVAMFIHWLTWEMRQRYLNLTVILGAAAALLLTLFFLLFLTSDIASTMLGLLVVLLALVLLLGIFQSRFIPAPWWKGVLGLFFEVELTFIAGAGFNLTLQRYIPWLDQQFPAIDVYAVIDSFLRGLAIAFLLLAVIRPLLRWNRFRS